MGCLAIGKFCVYWALVATLKDVVKRPFLLRNWLWLATRLLGHQEVDDTCCHSATCEKSLLPRLLSPICCSAGNPLYGGPSRTAYQVKK
jgi:hypothetical protein